MGSGVCNKHMEKVTQTWSRTCFRLEGDLHWVLKSVLRAFNLKCKRNCSVKPVNMQKLTSQDMLREV